MFNKWFCKCVDGFNTPALLKKEVTRTIYMSHPAAFEKEVYVRYVQVYTNNKYYNENKVKYINIKLDDEKLFVKESDLVFCGELKHE